MIPFDAHRLYQAERLRSREEIQRAHEQIARLAEVASELFRFLARPVAAAIRRLASWHNGAHWPAARAGRGGRMLETTDVHEVAADPLPLIRPR